MESLDYFNCRGYNNIGHQMILGMWIKVFLPWHLVTKGSSAISSFLIFAVSWQWLIKLIFAFDSCYYFSFLYQHAFLKWMQTVRAGHHYTGLWIVATLMSQSCLWARMLMWMPRYSICFRINNICINVRDYSYFMTLPYLPRMKIELNHWILNQTNLTAEVE